MTNNYVLSPSIPGTLGLLLNIGPGSYRNPISYAVSLIKKYAGLNPLQSIHLGTGVEQGYLDAIEITTDDTPTARGPTGRAIKSHVVSVGQNIAENHKSNRGATERSNGGSAPVGPSRLFTTRRYTAS